jgi:membrane protease YdiL (CAAX protease family)
MSVCQTCGKKYSKWVTPVSARGVCGDCFKAELRQEREAESQIDLAPALVAAAPPSEGNAEVVGEEAHPQPQVSLNVFLETLGVTLAFFGGRILLNFLGQASKSTLTTQGLVASSLPELGWILLVICLLNRSGSFQWRLRGSKKAWLNELKWGVVLLVTSQLARAMVARIGLELHIPSNPFLWTHAFRNHSTWVAFQVLAPLSAMYQELVCRVYMQSRLTQILRGHSISVVLISSCLFAGIHNYAPLQSINVFVAGLILGASYQLNGKIPRLVIAHAANNIISGFALMRG